jgi:dipeptidase E
LFGVNSNEELFYVNESKKELISIGIREKNIFDLNFFESFEILESDFDVVYVCGGNTFDILNSLREKKLDLLIEKVLLNNGVYVGVSAGSIIVGPSIKIAGWGSEGDLNNLSL